MDRKKGPHYDLGAIFLGLNPADKSQLLVFFSCMHAVCFQEILSPFFHFGSIFSGKFLDCTQGEGEGLEGEAVFGGFCF